MTNHHRDWLDWHKQYDDPASSLSRRLSVVRRELRHAVDGRDGPVRVISICAGQGRDVIPVLADSPRREDADVLLVELDPRNAERAAESARAAGLDRVRVLCADAAVTANYAEAVPADVILACGVFGNISDTDIKFTVERLPMLSAAGATVIWTRGGSAGGDLTSSIRQWFDDAGFREVFFDVPKDDYYRVGVNRLVRPPDRFDPNVKLFRFFR